VLTGSPESGRERIDAAIAAGETQTIALDRPVPVYVLYWTVIAQPDGTVDFRPDVYGRDKRLIAALAGRPKPVRASIGETECAGWAG
jgi:murein L,D-transpeptidase YcbB/YkuD